LNTLIQQISCARCVSLTLVHFKSVFQYMGIWLYLKCMSELALRKKSFSPSWLVLELRFSLSCCKIKFILEVCYETVKNKWSRTALRCLGETNRFITCNHSFNILWSLKLHAWQQRVTHCLWKSFRAWIYFFFLKKSFIERSSIFIHSTFKMSLIEKVATLIKTWETLCLSQGVWIITFLSWAEQVSSVNSAFSVSVSSTIFCLAIFTYVTIC